MISQQDSELLDDVFDLKSGAQECDVNSHSLGSLNLICQLELTLNLRKTKQFDDSKEAYTKLYKKILSYIDNISDVSIENQESYFENGTLSQKLHLHSFIIIKIKRSYCPNGFIEQISRFICKIIRRKYEEKLLYIKYNKYWSVPFTLQISSRPDYWQEYIRKNARSII